MHRQTRPHTRKPTRTEAHAPADGCAEELPGDADRDRLGHQGHAERIEDPLAHGAGKGLNVGGARAAPVRQGQDVLGGQGRARRIPGLGQVEAASAAGVVDEPGGTRLDQALPRTKTGRILGEGGRDIGGQDRVREEGTGAPRVVVARVQDHALAAAQLQDGGADEPARRT